jgi:EAL domain-containing protein (putative c-di-GMP-specific phosphodiesterase class I)
MGALGLHVIAEGVETEEQAALLSGLELGLRRRGRQETGYT